jgi:hypothetical protein
MLLSIRPKRTILWPEIKLGRILFNFFFRISTSHYFLVDSFCCSDIFNYQLSFDVDAASIIHFFPNLCLFLLAENIFEIFHIKDFPKPP